MFRTVLFLFLWLLPWAAYAQQPFLPDPGMGPGQPEAAPWTRQAPDDLLYEQGLAALTEGRYRDAANWFRQAGRYGHAAALYRVGALYEDGLGVAQSYQEAVGWYLKAADPEVERELREPGGPWWSYRRPVSKSAQYRLGELYAQGLGVKKDPKQAAAWFLRAGDSAEAAIAETPDPLPRIRYKLAELYETGNGIEADPERAATLYLSLARAGSPYATDAAVQVAREMEAIPAFRIYEHLAGLGVARGQERMAEAYANGDGVEKDREQAFEWYLNAGDTYLTQDRLEAARRMYAKVHQLEPKDPRTRNLGKRIRSMR